MKLKSILFITSIMLCSTRGGYAEKIVTIFDNEKSDCLSQTAEEIQITKKGLKQQKKFGMKLPKEFFMSEI